MDELDDFYRGLDGPSLAGFHAFNKVFKVRPKEAVSTKEVAMSNTVKGVIEEVKVNPANGRHAYRIEGKWYSTFVNEKTSEEAKEVLGGLAAGDSVEMEYSENKGFYNIDGVVSFTKGDGTVPERPAPAKPGFKKPWGGGNKGSGWKPEDKRPSIVSFAVSYSKDVMTKLLEGDDLKAQGPEAQVKFVLDNMFPLADEVLRFMLAKLKDLKYEFPKAE